ncbi:MAG: VCBS repeat-containing protein, partial [Anaerolineales bacterium]|nr:VCBS repeat-containing protein [Anaerolineales bacterium]
MTSTSTATPTLTSTATTTQIATPTSNLFIQVIDPNGGETLTAGQTYRITWDSSPAIESVSLGYKSCASCLDWIVTTIPNIGFYDWSVDVGNTENTQFKIYIIGYGIGAGSGSDTSDNDFTVVSPTPTVTLTNTPIPPITIGETSILTSAYSGIGNQLVAQQVTLSQSATIQSLSYYVSTASGQLRLGIYNNNGSNPGTLVAETVVFTPAFGWNTQPVITPTLLPAGTYWLAFLPQNSAFAGRISYSGTGRYYGYTFGALPASYSTSASSGAFHFSFYATLTLGTPPTSTPSSTFTPPSTSTQMVTPTTTPTSVVSCAVINASGSGTLFQPYRQYDCGKYAHAVGIGDFNNDGKKDVALSIRTNSSGSPSSLLVFTQDTNGDLSQPHVYAGGNRAEHMAVGDVNNDGLDDVVTLNFSDNTISLFIQNSGGAFSDRITYATNSGPDAVAIGDVNNDGLNDVIVAHHTHATIGVFTQESDGTLNSMTTYPSVAAGFDDIAIGDVNGDGLNDVVKMNGQGSVNSNIMVYLQNANGTLNTSLNYSIASCTSSCLSNGVAIGDVTGDGRLDVVLSYGGNRPNSNIAVFAQDTNGT